MKNSRFPERCRRLLWMLMSQAWTTKLDKAAGVPKTSAHRGGASPQRSPAKVPPGRRPSMKAWHTGLEVGQGAIERCLRVDFGTFGTDTSAAMRNGPLPRRAHAGSRRAAAPAASGGGRAGFRGLQRALGGALRAGEYRQACTVPCLTVYCRHGRRAAAARFL